MAHWVFAFGVPEEGGAGAGASARLFGADTGGWIVARLGALDFAGGTAVHVNAGAAALALGIRAGGSGVPLPAAVTRLDVHDAASDAVAGGCAVDRGGDDAGPVAPAVLARLTPPAG